MINLFDIAVNDQSVVYLGQIFGYVGSVLPVNNPQIMVGILFKALNTMALTIGAILVVYVTVVGLLKTAQEGEFLGKHWNSLWVPVRTVMGIAALFPTTTGYSAIQVVIMWIVLQGVGAADTLWTKALEYVNVAGSPYASAGGINATAAITLQPTMKSLFQGLVFQASAKAAYPPIPMASASGIVNSIKYYCADPNADKTFCATTDADMLDIKSGPQVTGNSYRLGPPGEMSGSMLLCDEATLCKRASGIAYDSTECIACKTQRTALQAIVPVLGAVASQVVVLDHAYAKFHESQRPVNLGLLSSVAPPAPPPVPAPDWVKTYCSDKGVSPAQCCVYEGTNCDKSLFPDSVYRSGNNSVDLTNTSYVTDTKGAITPSRSAMELYLAYPLGAYLNGSDFINAAVGEYMAAMVAAVSADIQKKMDQQGTGGGSSSGYLTAAKNYGWILAGVFYYKIAGENANNIKAATITLPTISSPDVSKNTNNFRLNYAASGGLLSAMMAANSSSGSSFTNTTQGVVGGSDVAAAIGSSSAALLQSWQNSLSGTGSGDFNVKAQNPLIAIASFGYTMMLIAQILFFVLTGLATVMTIVATINPIILGTGLTMNPFGEGIKALLGLTGPFFVILVSALFSIGAMLGIYVPLIPFMIFTLGAIGWLIATIEAMVAGPIIALGILSPGGQHDILGRSEPALMLIFNLFLRPSLMVLGMMISMLLAIVVLKLINAGFLAAAASVATPGLFEQILLIAVYTSFVITGMNKAFSLIYIIPERVLTYLGASPVSYGEEQAMGASKQALEGASSSITGAAKEAGGAMPGGAEKGMMAAQGQEEKKKEDAKKGAGQAQVTPNKGADAGKGGGAEPDG